MNLYTYNSEIIRIVDGDTAQIKIDLGLKIFYKTLCRLSGINAPELNSLDETVRQKAVESRDYLIMLLPAGTQVYIDSKSLDKYGRPIVVIWLGTMNVNKEMISSGNAVVYK